MRDTGACRDVFKRPVAAISIQPVPRPARSGAIDKRSAVHEEDIDPAVVVEVEEQSAAAHDFREMTVGAGAVDVPEINAGGSCATLVKPGAACGTGRRARGRLAVARPASSASDSAASGLAGRARADSPRGTAALQPIVLELFVGGELAPAVFVASERRVRLGQIAVDIDSGAGPFSAAAASNRVIGFGGLSGSEQCEAEIDVRNGGIGLELEGLAQQRDGLLMIAVCRTDGCLSPQAAELEVARMRRRILRLQTLKLVELALPLVGPAEPDERGGQHVPRLPVRRIEVEGAARGIGGFGVLALPQIDLRDRRRGSRPSRD